MISLRALDFAPIQPKLFALAGVPYSRVERVDRRVSDVRPRAARTGLGGDG